MKYVDSSRRQIVMGVLLGLASAGAAVRYWAPNPSLARDIGTLMLVLWLPAVGNLVAFVIRKLPRRKAAAFDEAAAFVEHVIANLEPIAEHADVLVALGAERRCLLVVGKEGFTARTQLPLAQVFGGDASGRRVPLQLLRPDLALRRLPVGTAFYLGVGEVAIAQGAVLELPAA